MMEAKLKICGMKDPSNILEVVNLQPDYIGFIFYKGSKRYVDGLLPSFVKNLPAGIKKTGVFVNEEISRIEGLVLHYGLNAVQLHGTEPAAYCQEIKALLAPEGVDVIKAFGVDEEFDFSVLEEYSAVDFFLFDTQTPDHGGSGKTFNWQLLNNYTLDKPYFLSGGIGMENIEQLKQIDDTRLYAIDVNSRFELAPGLKDIDKLNDFKIRL